MYRIYKLKYVSTYVCEILGLAYITELINDMIWQINPQNKPYIIDKKNHIVLTESANQLLNYDTWIFRIFLINYIVLTKIYWKFAKNSGFVVSELVLGSGKLCR